MRTYENLQNLEHVMQRYLFSFMSVRDAGCNFNFHIQLHDTVHAGQTVLLLTVFLIHTVFYYLFPSCFLFLPSPLHSFYASFPRLVPTPILKSKEGRSAAHQLTPELDFGHNKFTASEIFTVCANTAITTPYKHATPRLNKANSPFFPLSLNILVSRFKVAREEGSNVERARERSHGGLPLVSIVLPE